MCRGEGLSAGAAKRAMTPLQLLHCRRCYTKPGGDLHVCMQKRNSRHVRQKRWLPPKAHGVSLVLCRVMRAW